MASSKAKVSLKLLIDTKAKRVLFAEAGKDFVDFLFNLLRLPVGTVVKLLTKQSMHGVVLILTRTSVMFGTLCACPGCDSYLSREMDYVTREGVVQEVESEAGEGGFVKGVVTYMVMDDLVVIPMSTISGITMLNKFNVKDVGALDERVVQMGMAEGLKLLKASLESKKVLTSVFLGNTGA
ncbi:hypothetical protein Vadar_027781 [Vaccinium darrowii]|uniref:Uncharacterized protein n=1 Tax=Vaccinium darrowii TaxID=229202 RepID=A0ACB7XKL1_9ERIC|nr:hypothetical protein Vadar_027781 [Vaccinium darrowii]